MTYLFTFLISQSLQWDAPDDERIRGFRIYDIDHGISFDAGLHHSYDLAGKLLPGLGYRWIITSYSSDDESNPSPMIAYDQPYPASRLELASPGTLYAHVYPNLNYEVQATGDFKTWTTIQTFFSDSSVKKIAIDSTQQKLFFRLRQIIDPMRMTMRAQSILTPPMPSVPALPAPTNVRFRDKLKNYLKYKPGHAPKIKKGAEVMTRRKP